MSLDAGKSMRGCLAVVGLLLMAGGCARPAGELFPPLQHPRVWPAPPEQARVRLVGVLSDSRDLSAAKSGGEVLLSALRGSRQPINLVSPHGLAFREPGWLVVADGGGGAVHVIDLVGRTHRAVLGFAAPDGTQERLGSPVGVCWVGSHVVFTDAARGEVIEVEADGTFVRRFGGDHLQRPVGIAYVPDREILAVVDGGHHKLVLFRRDGTLLRTIGERGTGPGEFNFPSHVCFDGEALWIADSGNARLQRIGLDGEVLGGFGRAGNAAGDLALPKGVAVDSDGHVYVVDARFENVQIFDPEGSLLLAFGEEGNAMGSFSLPAGIAIDAANRIFVADAGNRRIQVFQYLGGSS